MDFTVSRGFTVHSWIIVLGGVVLAVDCGSSADIRPTFGGAIWRSVSWLCIQPEHVHSRLPVLLW